ncbi:hypothetical protein [Nocardia sp. NPDC059239]|uniref:hypothetical protein n=1 Tax=Nocardia sp. NPDC059239 TaxID=3346785 RepID=UPI0036CE2F6A
MDAMVRRLLVVAAVVVAMIGLAPLSAMAQPTTTAPAGPTAPAPASPTTSPVTTTSPTDLYSDCRDLGDNIPIPGLDKAAEWLCDGTTAATDPTGAANEAAKGILGKVAGELADGWKKGIALMFSWWYRTPITSSIGSDGTSSFVDTVHSYLRYFQIAIFIVSMGLALVRIAWAQGGARNQQVVEAVTLAKRSVLVSSSLAGIAVLGDGAMRSASTWILEGLAGQTSPSEAVERLMKVNSLGGFLGAGLLFVFALLGLIGVISQMMFILVQIAVSKLVLGVLPLAAAASGTEAGRQAYRKLLAWVVVFILFPPATAIVYGTAFALAFGSDDAQGALAGMILLTLSALTLPSLVRLLVPMAGQVAGGSGAAALGGAVLATGAIPLARQAISGSGGGGDRPSSSGGRSDGDKPSGAVPTPSGAQPSGGGSGGGRAPSTVGASGATTGGSRAAGASGGAAAGASGAAAAAGGPVGLAVAGVVQGAQKVADGARNSVGSAEPPPAGPTGAPSGGRSDGN